MQNVPVSLSTYIQRCLADTTAPDDKAWVKERLKVIIKAFSTSEQMWNTNWDRWPTIKRGGFAGYAPQGASLPPVSPTGDAGAAGRDAWAAAGYHHQQQQQQGAAEGDRDRDRDRDRWGGGGAHHAGRGSPPEGYGYGRSSARGWRYDQHQDEDMSDDEEGGRGHRGHQGGHQDGAAGLRRGVAGLSMGGRGGGKAAKQQQKGAGKGGKRKKGAAGGYDSDEEASPQQQLWSKAEQHKRAKRGARFEQPAPAAAAATPVDPWLCASQSLHGPGKGVQVAARKRRVGDEAAGEEEWGQ
jgi:hypothetical protein